MNCAQIIFSPTGRTMRTAKVLTDVWETKVETVDLTNPKPSQLTFQGGDLVLLAVPSYGGRVPGPVAQRLARIQGSGAYCVLLCVYGNRAYEDTLVELQDLAERQGFRVFAAVAAVAEHSIIREYAAGRPDTQDVERLQQYSRSIWDAFNCGQDIVPPMLPGNRPYKKASYIGLIPQTEKSCIECGLCAAQCPVQAISRTAPKMVERMACISCMRCVSQCPQNARKIDITTRSKIAIMLEKSCSTRKECELYIRTLPIKDKTETINILCSYQKNKPL